MANDSAVQARHNETRAELERLEQAIAQSTAEGDTLAAATLHFRAAQICLAQTPQDLTTREEALTHLWASWQLQPEDLDVRTVLARYLERGEQLEEVAGLYSSTAEHMREGPERDQLLLRAAKLLGRGGDPAEALELLRRMQSREPGLVHQRARLLRGWLGGSKDTRNNGAPLPDELRCELLEALLGDLHGAERVDPALELATLHRQAGRAEQSLQACLEVLAIQPAHPEALARAQAQLEQLEEREELAEVLERAARAAPQDQQLSLLRRLASLMENELGAPARAARFWWKAWELEPTSRTEPGRLKELYAGLEQWPNYRRVLEREILHAPDTVTKVAAFRELARLQLDVFDDPAAAARTHGFVLHLIPDDEQALEARIEIFQGRRMDDELALALRRYAAHTRDRAKHDRLCRRLARLEARLPDRGYVLRTVRNLDAADPENRALVRELREAHGDELGRELGLVLLKMERRADTDRDGCIELALVLARESIAAQQPGAAVECYRQALELEPALEEARDGLERLARRGEPAMPTADELAQQADGLLPQQPARAVRLLIQAARLERSPETAADYLHRAVEYCPSSPIPELQLLEEALRAAELLDDLARLLEHQAAVEQKPGRRKDTLRALAQLQRERLKQPERALETLNQVLALDPSDTEAIKEVRQLHSVLGNHQALARVLEDLLQQATGRDRIPLLAELGQIHAHRLNDHRGALRFYGELLAMVPSDPKALSYCRAHDEAAGNYRSVAVMLCRAAETMDDPLSRAELHREIAQIAEQQLSDPDFAITHWRQVVELCPADSAPRAELKRLLRQVGRWADLERVLLSEVSRSLRPEEKVPTYLDLARIAAGELQDDRRASSYLRNALQLAPDNREVLNQLENIHERLGQWRELASVLRRHSDAVDDKEEQARLLLKAARVLFVHVGRDEEALATCRQIREMRPADRGAATLMAEILGKRGKWRDKAQLLGEQIAVESDPPELGRLHLELGRLMLDKLDDSEEAAAHFELALELSSGAAEILPLLRQLYESLGRWDLLVELIRKRAMAESISNAERALALCEIGRIKQEQLGDLQGAKEAFERAIHLDPSHQEALQALRALAAGQEQWRELVALARKELQLTENPEERARLLLEIGEIQYRRMERPGAAAETLAQALELRPDDDRTAELLGAIYFETEDWERAEQLLEKVVSSGVELDNLHEYHFRLGFANERLGREDDAFSHYVKSFGKEPMYLPTLTRLVELCYTRNQWENTLRIGEAIVNTYADQKTPEELATIYVRVGLCELHLAQQEAAVKQLQNMILEHGQVPASPTDAWVDAAETWAATPLEPTLLGGVNPDVLSKVIKAMERALSLVAGHADALQVLAALALSRRDWERCLRYIDRAVDSIRDNPRLQVGLLVCAGDVAHKHLLSPHRAQELYRRALDLLPGSDLARDRLDMLEVTPARYEPPPPRRAPSRPPAPPRPRQATPPPPPPDAGAEEAVVARTPTKPLPGIMPPLPSDVGDEPEQAPHVVRPAPRSRPRRNDDD